MRVSALALGEMATRNAIHVWKNANPMERFPFYLRFDVFQCDLQECDLRACQMAGPIAATPEQNLIT